jgi:Tetratricopeptide repeat
MTKLRGDQSPELLTLLEMLSDDLCDQRKLAEASDVQRRYLAVASRLDVNVDLRFVQMLKIHVNTEIERKNYVEAEDYAKRAAAILENVHGAESLELAQLLETLASLTLERKAFAEAEEPARRALAIREKALGADDPTLIPILKVQTAIRAGQGQLPDAILLSKRLLALCSKGNEDKSTEIQATEYLIDLYKQSGKFTNRREIQALNARLEKLRTSR